MLQKENEKTARGRRCMVDLTGVYLYLCVFNWYPFGFPKDKQEQTGFLSD
jgi:hypothetical protein